MGGSRSAGRIRSLAACTPVIDFPDELAIANGKSGELCPVACVRFHKGRLFISYAIKREPRIRFAVLRRAAILN